jgi:hypothetical protein
LKGKLQAWAIFKRGYSEGTYPLNVISTVLIFTNTLLLAGISHNLIIELFALCSFATIVTMYAVGRWNLTAKNKKSLLRADVLADTHLQMEKRALRDIMIKLGLDTSDVDFWLLETKEEAMKRVLGDSWQKEIIT